MTADRINQPPPLRPLSRQQRKAMLATIQACDLVLATVKSKDDLKKALECLTRLTADELVHARTWLQTPAAITAGISLESVDKMVALIESLERVRPRVEQAAAAAKVRGALHNMPTEVKPEDVAKLKAQVEN